MRAFADMAVDGNSQGRRGQRLKSWKEIAAFFGADERTVRRWEARGLPVHRIPGGARATVYADVSELQQWMQTPAAADASEQEAVKPTRHFRPLVALAAAIAVLVGALAYYRSSSAPQVHQPDKAASDLYFAGAYAWERRTPDSLRRAAALFREAIARDPTYAEPHAGLAKTYLLLREYAGVPDAEAYPVARDAARRALALNPQLGDAHAALAFVTFYWDHDFAAGLEGFRRAAAHDPRSVRVRHWYATALYHARRIPEALTQIDEAQRLNPESQAILADKALILFHSGRSAEAKLLLRQIARIEPAFMSPHAYLAIIHQSEGNYSGWLAEARIACRLTGDTRRLALLDSAAAKLEAGGPRRALAAMLERQHAMVSRGEESTLELAATQALLGDKVAALRSLGLSLQRRETALLSIRMDPRFRDLHANAEFQRIAKAAGET